MIAVVESGLFTLVSNGEPQMLRYPDAMVVREAGERVSLGPQPFPESRQNAAVGGESMKSRGAARLAGGNPPARKTRYRKWKVAGLAHEVTANHASVKYALEAQNEEISHAS